MNTKYNTKALVEAGLISAIMIVLILLVGYVPIFSMVGTVVLPIPIVILYLRYGFRTSFIAIVVTALLGTILVNPYVALSSTLICAIIGLNLGFSIKKGYKASTTLLLLTFSLFVSLILNFAVTLLFVERTSLTGFANMIADIMHKQELNTIDSLNKTMNVNNSEQVNQLKDMINQITPQLILSILPGTLFVFAFFQAYINYVICKGILKRFKVEMKKIETFDKVYIDNRIGALIIVSVCIGLIVDSRGLAIGKYITNSMLIVMTLIFTIIGCSIIYYYLINKYKVNKKAATFIVIILLLMFFSSRLIMMIGFADMVFDFRKLDPNRLFKRKEV